MCISKLWFCRHIAMGLTGCLLIAACGNGSNNSKVVGTDEIVASIQEVRAGIVVGDAAITAFRAGDRETGASTLEEAKNRMKQGLELMRRGADQMHQENASACKAQMDQVMTTLANGMQDITSGQGMLMDSDPANDDAGLSKIQSGRDLIHQGVVQMGMDLDAGMGEMP